MASTFITRGKSCNSIMRLTSNSNTIKSPRRKGAARRRTDRRRRRMFRPAAKSAHGLVRFARPIDDPPRSRVPTHNLGGIVRIEYARRTGNVRWLAFRPFRSSSLSRSLSSSADDAAAGYFVSTPVPRLRIIDYRRVRRLIPRAT